MLDVRAGTRRGPVDQRALDSQGEASLNENGMSCSSRVERLGHAAESASDSGRNPLGELSDASACG
jgi:hypothetical protein